jgi:hypothetical protein
MSICNGEHTGDGGNDDDPLSSGNVLTEELAEDLLAMLEAGKLIDAPIASSRSFVTERTNTLIITTVKQFFNSIINLLLLLFFLVFFEL